MNKTDLLCAAPIAIAILSANPARADDAKFDWSGPYAGAFVGYGWNEVRLKGDAPSPTVSPPALLSFTPTALFLGGSSPAIQSDGVLAGAEIGYDIQFDNLVTGVAAGFAYDGADGSKVRSGVKFSADADWSGSLRARAGWAFSRYLPYVTGGVAVSRVEAGYVDLGGSQKDAKNLVGFTVGGGLEAFVTDRITIKGEYVYSDYGVKHKAGPVVDKVDVGGHAAKVGVNYRFRWD